MKACITYLTAGIWMLGLQPLLWIKSWIPKGSETDSSIIRTITNATFSWLMKLASIMLQPIYYLCVTCINVRKHSSSFFLKQRRSFLDQCYHWSRKGKTWERQREVNIPKYSMSHLSFSFSWWKKALPLQGLEKNWWNGMKRKSHILCASP